MLHRFTKGTDGEKVVPGAGAAQGCAAVAGDRPGPLPVRLLAAQLRRDGKPVSHATVTRVWQHFGIQPHRSGRFKFSTDPQLEAKVRDIVGLYLDPPAKAIVLRVGEMSQIQALDRTAPMPPLRPGLPEPRTHDYVRHGTTTLFAALEVATGKVVDACYDRHRHQEFLRPQAGREGLPAA